MTPIQIVYNSKSWQDFERQLSKLEFNKRGLVFEWLCVFYLQIEPRYKTTYRRVLHSSEYLKDIKIKRKLGLRHNEQGTDIVGETFEGKIEIIQCKYKNNKNKNINAKDINDPIRIASGREARKWVDTILVCSNLKGFTKNKTLDELDIQFRTVLEGDFRQLTKEDFENIRRVIDKKIPIYKGKTPFEHQKIAIANAKEHFKKSKRGKIIHACGTGKTLTSYFVFRELKPKLTLYIVPGLQLINQALIEWTKESLADKSPISPFVVCSDKSNEKIGECEPALWLQELGIKVSNKKEDLEMFLKSKRKNKVIFSTYQSGNILAKNIRALNKQIDFAFFDEAHNTATSKERLSAHLLWDKNIPIKKRLFMTATPKQFVGNSERFSSMDNTEIYGELIDEVTVKEAIEGIGGRKLLNDYQIITQIVKKDSYVELLAENPFVVDKVKLPEKVELKLLSSAITLKKIRKEKNIKNVISFHGRRNRANAFRKGAKKLDDGLNTFYVNGKQSGTERNNILEDFTNNPPSLVANAKCLSEGVNVPSIDAIMFVDPKQSRVDITQAIGRALRKGKKEKGTSYIIIPTIVDKDNPDNIEEAYQQILMVLRSMSEHDGRIVEYFRLLREGKKPIKAFVEVNSEYLPEEFDLKDFTEKLHFRAWDRVARLGRRPWEQAREWARGLGMNTPEWRAFVKTDQKPLDIPSDPRRAYRKEWISYRDFFGRPSEEEEMETYIKEYKKNANGKLIPFPIRGFVTDSGYKLELKMRGIMNSYNRGILPRWKKDLIENELITKGLFSWEGRDVFSWKLNFNTYKEFVEETGLSTPKKRAKYKGLVLETWFLKQKTKYKTLQGEGNSTAAPLEKWQLNWLKSINFPFDDSYDSKWNEMYECVKPIIIKYKGKIPVKNAESKKTYKCHGTDVRRWISKQRGRYKNGTLETEKIEKLEQIKYWSWDPFDDAFKKNFEILIDYIKKEKVPNPSQKTQYKGLKIGLFLSKLRIGRFDNKFTKDMRIELEKLGTNFKPTRKIGSVIYYD